MCNAGKNPQKTLKLKKKWIHFVQLAVACILINLQDEVALLPTACVVRVETRQVPSSFEDKDLMNVSQCYVEIQTSCLLNKRKANDLTKSPFVIA